MTTQDIAALIKEPERSGQFAPEELSSLADKYPYSQIFSLLYLQSLGKRNDLRFDEELVKHSFRITDRARLYRLIHDFQVVEEHISSTPAPPEFETEVASPVEHESSPSLEEEDSTAEIARDFTSDYRREESEDIPLVAEPESTYEPIDPVSQESEIPELESNAPPDSLPEEPQAAKTSEEIEVEMETEDEESVEENADPLDELILQYAVAASYRLDDLTPEEVEEMERRKEEKVEEVSATETEEFHTTDSEIEARQSFTSWFSTNRNALPEDKEEQKAVRSVVDDFQSFDPSEELFGEIEKPKHAFFSPARKAKESLREDDLPVSETLAKIYAMQGNYPKAIRAYEQLSLIYPEKKTFFATLIADLEQKLNLK